MFNAKKQQRLLEQAAKLAECGQFHLAIPKFRTLVQVNPSQPEITLHLAKALGLSGQWEEAAQWHDQLKQAHPHSRELLVRIARDREEWLDLQGALSGWSELAADLKSANAPFMEDANFHRVRLLERTNRIDEAREAWGDTSEYRTDTWGWHWLEGKLLQRAGKLEEAKSAYLIAYERASGEHQIKCATAIAQVSDRLKDYPLAYQWIQTIIELRASETEVFKKQHSLIDELPVLPELKSFDEQQHRPLLFLTGHPRAGTTLLAHQLAQNYQLDLSEEFDYCKHLVESVAFHPREVSPHKLTRKLGVKKQVAVYWRAQLESGVTTNVNGEVPLLEKNPSMAMLVPWLLAIFPHMKILWLERDLRDLWISSVSLDVPINGVTCWWQSPSDYGAWCQQLADLRDQLEYHLPEGQFIKVNYQDLVSDQNQVIAMVGERFGLEPRVDEERETPLVTSPSYEEVIQPVTTNRLERWRHYRPLLSDDDRATFDALLPDQSSI